MRELARHVLELQPVWRVPAWRGLALRWELPSKRVPARHVMAQLYPVPSTVVRVLAPLWLVLVLAELWALLAPLLWEAG